MKFRPLFYILSFLFLSTSLYSIARYGFRPSIDFVGGTVWEFTFSDSLPPSEKINTVFEQSEISLSSITPRSNNGYTLKFANISSDQKSVLDQKLKDLGQGFEELRFETLGPSLGKELLGKTIFAVILSSLALFIFIGRRFNDLSFGISAVLAMFHDTFILIGAFSIFGYLFGAELDSLFVTAVLTTLSSSVHDTVVTFDRIRELKRQHFTISWVDLANQAVTETLTRSINNSMTIVFMLTSLVMLGGSTTRWFAAALLVGVILGTYSSTGVAIPLVLFFKRKHR